MSYDKIIDKIRKLLALSTSSNEHEAAAAAARAQALMTEHQIEEAQLRVDGGGANAEPIEKDAVLDDSSNKYVQWKGNIGMALCESMGCHLYQARGTFRIFGRQSVARTVSYLYQYLVNEVDRLANEAWKIRVGKIVDLDSDEEAQAPTRDTSKSWKLGFRLGAARSISQRLRDQAKAQATAQSVSIDVGAANSQALVILRKDQSEVNSGWNEFSSGFRHSRRFFNDGSSDGSSDGYRAGRNAGDKISIGGNARRLGKAPDKISRRQS